jgi:hypothetical protein
MKKKNLVVELIEQVPSWAWLLVGAFIAFNIIDFFN